MNRELARKVANSVLYEGYMLYPYRPSAIKNRQRWTFGILYPPAYHEVASGTERSAMHTECILQTQGTVNLNIEARFLHLVARQIYRLVGDRLDPVDSLSLEGRIFESWDEGIERTFSFDTSLTGKQRVEHKFAFPASYADEWLRDATGVAVGRRTRRQQPVQGSVEVSAERVRDDAVKLVVDIHNRTSLPAEERDRNSALLRSLVSTHSILTVSSGEFVSLLDPPARFEQDIKSCQNTGNFPVLAGDEKDCDMLLCSPIVLYDYPKIAPESAGDFYDATEMDEMLTLRVMTLTDQEKNEMGEADDRVRNLLRRTEESAREQLMKTHGTIRGMRPTGGS